MQNKNKTTAPQRHIETHSHTLTLAPLLTNTTSEIKIKFIVFSPFSYLVVGVNPNKLQCAMFQLSWFVLSWYLLAFM